MSNQHRPAVSRSNGGASGPPVTDEELMLWVDGELDAERASEVEARIAADPRARAIVAALRLGADVVSSDALDRAARGGADAIADSVMAAIDREDARPAVANVVPLPSRRTPIVTGLLAAAAAAAAVFFFPRAGVVAPPGPGPQAAFTGAVIDVVDFGARPGTIFYVPSEDESTTAVVWLTEDDTSPDEDEPSPSSGETL